LPARVAGTFQDAPVEHLVVGSHGGAHDGALAKGGVGLEDGTDRFE
jgi:hypothetical protein